MLHVFQAKVNAEIQNWGHIRKIYSGNWVKVTSIAISLLYDNTGTNWLECVLINSIGSIIRTADFNCD